ncbi:RNA-directed DNA polymerase, eukaryota, partial [Tanacetum coccineum]
MNVLSLNIQGIGSKGKKQWVRELCSSRKVNFLTLQETKVDQIDEVLVKLLWGNSTFDYAFSSSVGYSRGVVCVWDKSMFIKANVSVVDYFVLVEGAWKCSISKTLMIEIYAPQALSEKRMLWGYLHDVISRWSGEVIVMGDFNEVRMDSERYGSIFHKPGADAFNHFITSSGLNDIPLGGYKFTWVHKNADKMSKLDQFLVSDGVLASFPSLTGRFDSFVKQAWQEDKVDERNSMIYLKKKLQLLKQKLRAWGSFPRSLSNEQEDILEAMVTDQEIKMRCGIMMLNELVSSEQSAFIRGRQILDGPMILNEVLKWCSDLGGEDVVYGFSSGKWEPDQGIPVSKRSLPGVSLK